MTLVLVYLVILAGSVVRATGSGMGCPDWPKCFGHLIPPTQLAQLQYEEGKRFRKGEFIIWEEALWKARHDLVAGAYINPEEWSRYTKHDYAHFNVMHTWTEYVNRLMGALLGLVALAMLWGSLRVLREDAALAWMSLLTVFLIGFEAWLGALVVDSNLTPAKITTHMLVALVIIAVVIGAIARAKVGSGARRSHLPGHRPLVPLLLIASAATVLQVVLGTQVREQVDALGEASNTTARAGWVEQLGAVFKVHRAFAYAVLLVNGALVWLLHRRWPGWLRVRLAAVWLLTLLALVWGTGAALAMFGLPAYLQPAHLVLATLIFGLQLWIACDVWLHRGAARATPS